MIVHESARVSDRAEGMDDIPDQNASVSTGSLRIVLSKQRGRFVDCPLPASAEVRYPGIVARDVCRSHVQAAYI